MRCVGFVRVRGRECGDTRSLSWWGDGPFLLSFSIHGCADFSCDGGVLDVPKTEPSDLARGLADNIKPAMKGFHVRACHWLNAQASGPQPHCEQRLESVGRRFVLYMIYLTPKS